MKSRLFSMFCAGIFSLGLVSTANGAIVQYKMTYDGSITGSSGTGTFSWDTLTSLMTELVWGFGGGNTGGIRQSTLDLAFFGGTFGAALFETYTGEDVHPSSTSFATTSISTGNTLIDPFPGASGGVNFHGINHPDFPSKYIFFDAGNVVVAEGFYSVVAVVPIPAAVWLFGSGLVGLVGVARRKKAA